MITTYSATLGARERARDSTQKRKENICDPTYDSQAGSGATVSAIEEIQGAAQSHRQPGTEKPNPESRCRCRKPDGREHMQPAQGDNRPAGEGIETIHDPHILALSRTSEARRPLYLVVLAARVACKFAITSS